LLQALAVLSELAPGAVAAAAQLLVQQNCRQLGLLCLLVPGLQQHLLVVVVQMLQLHCYQRPGSSHHVHGLRGLSPLP
jgi:hypothetical protein